MNCDPMIIYNIFLDNEQSFNTHAASTHALEAFLRSRFIGQVFTIVLSSRAFLTPKHHLGRKPLGYQSFIR